MNTREGLIHCISMSIFIYFMNSIYFKFTNEFIFLKVNFLNVINFKELNFENYLIIICLKDEKSYEIKFSIFLSSKHQLN